MVTTIKSSIREKALLFLRSFILQKIQLEMSLSKTKKAREVSLPRFFCDLLTLSQRRQ